MLTSKFFDGTIETYSKIQVFLLLDLCAFSIKFDVDE